MLPEDLIQKSYALAYAAFRLAGNIDNPAIRQSIESKGLQVLNDALEDDIAGLKKAAKRLEYIVAFGRDSGHIHPQNSEVMLAEIDHLKNGLTLVISSIPAIPKEDLFPEPSSIPAESEVFGGEQNNPATESGNPAIPDLMGAPALTRQGDESFLLRKEKILEIIRQSGNCRMRDLQEAFPGISERTLRYDLQRLAAEGGIERGGNGGPATYYKIK